MASMEMAGLEPASPYHFTQLVLLPLRDSCRLRYIPDGHQTTLAIESIIVHIFFFVKIV